MNSKENNQVFLINTHIQVMQPYLRPFARDHRQITPTGAEEASNVFFPSIKCISITEDESHSFKVPENSS